MGLYIDEDPQKYKDYLVIVKSGEGESIIKTITGIIINQNLTISMGAEFAAATEYAGTSQLAKGVGISALARGASKVGLENVVRNFGNEILNNLIMSAERWSAGSKFTFSTSFTVVNNSKLLMSGFNGWTDFYSNLTKLTQADVQSPLEPIMPHYASLATAGKYFDAIGSGDYSGIESKMFTVRIGEWFECDKLLVTGADIDYSTHVDENGSPIFATVTLSFSTYRSLSSYEWAKIIKR